MSIATYSPPEYASNGAPGWLTMMDRAHELADVIANTDFVPRGLRGNPPAILAAILYGHEVGIGPMQSLAKIAVIDGRPTLASETQRGLILAAGHEIWPEESTTTRAVVCGRRRGEAQTSRVTWTLDDAKRARIAGKPSWQAYPRQMLLARASAELARALFPDVIAGLGAAEELVDLVDEDERPLVEAEQPEPSTRRRRRRAPATEPEPTPEPEPAQPESPSDAQLRKLMALFGERGYGDRVERLAYSSRLLDRPVSSSRELSKLDASRLIDALESEPVPAPEPEPESTPEPTPEADPFPEGF